MLRKALLILSGNAFKSLMLLGRNLTVARLVSIEDYGIAATFAISMAVVEMASGLGLQQLIIQDKDGNDPKLQAGLHGFNLLRSLLAGSVLFLIASPIAHFLGIPEIAWAYQLLAIVPILRGLEHFDIYRMNRKMQFLPLVLVKTIPVLLALLSIWPLYSVFGDYRVMLYSVLLQWATTLVASHIVAKRRYQLSFDQATMRKTFKFGWPLLINNIMLFAVFQGDKLIVGHAAGMEMLAIFSMGVTLTLAPTLVMASTTQQFMLPQLSGSMGDPLKFRNLANTALQISLLNGLLLLSTIVLFGPSLISWLLGQKYAGLQPILNWFAIQQALRVFKSGSSIVALAKGHTSNAMIANIFRIMALPLTWYLAKEGASLEVILWVAIVAELCSYLISLLLVVFRLNHPVRRILPSIGCVAFTVILLGLQTVFRQQTGMIALGTPIIIVLLLPICIFSMTDLRLYFRDKMFLGN